jgi:valyl-tRNA synthetase
MNVPAGARIPLVIVGADETTSARVRHNDETLNRLARLDSIYFADNAPTGAALVFSG